MTRRGFTLLELLVTLTIGAAAVIVAGMVVRSITATHASLARARRDVDRSHETLRNLEQWLGSIDVGIEDAQPFTGSEGALDCSTWVQVPGGWMERTTLQLRFAGDALIANVGGRVTILLRPVDDVRFAYLDAIAEEGLWRRGWASVVGVPVAVRVIVSYGAARTPDSLIVIVGTRG